MRISLNGWLILIYGVCRHQHRPHKGWAVSKTDINGEVPLLKRLGMIPMLPAPYPITEDLTNPANGSANHTDRLRLSRIPVLTDWNNSASGESRIEAQAGRNRQHLGDGCTWNLSPLG
jgi:hypothetical protein